MMLKRILSLSMRKLIALFVPLIVDGCYNGLWDFRKTKQNCIKQSKFWKSVYYDYLARYGCWIGINAKIDSAPRFPHGLNGIFISQMSEIGKDCVIFHQVTIGSNLLKNHPRNGSPKIGNNVYIGAGAKIIGNVIIGDNCRIGANCVVVKDMPANTTAVAASTRFIQSEGVNDNSFQSPESYLKAQLSNG
jgi:serine acetyltransferase